MALLKDITQPSYAVATYHRVLRVNIDAVMRTVTITVASYANAGARNIGAPPISTKDVTLPMSRFTDDIRRIPYNVLHQFEGTEFQDAQDDTQTTTGPIDLSVLPPPPLPPSSQSAPSP